MNNFEINIGERVKKLRNERELTLQDVANMTGFSKALISQIENNVVTPPINTLAKIAKVLNVKMTYFFEEEINYKDYYLVPSDKRKFVFREGAKHGYLYEELASIKNNDLFETFIVSIKPSSGEKKLFSHEGYEFMFLLSGNIRMYLNNNTVELKEGDSIAFNSKIPHYAESLINDDSKVLSVRVKNIQFKS
ncbi:helix-turn-helix domain-containing protein [Deferribacteraceae bacterium V6Fe1]|jgi:transcriptional regulator with XRE-family HTH domain|uniref:helix-turn-helix domain-containing protein n=1 Tax=Deferrivibrio essentukiensis TaxID=2880922 RepID=UPI0019CB04BE|nr:helix-turn-helix domain-containing protein [Deferrivibrio essentukiensis]MBC7196184.1 helix-turn-helix domain-containing protein [Deferribacterales bacterium]MBZ4672003.1 helix-turn-helix domain protein [Deferribacteraceae bacterium]MCB4204128.1 helix-turn-helix domain-containing protein [Deferrivibrio essentukiensis]UOD34404.1 helix-turn-helix domain-containing protein [Deferribacteraceae bacterium V6Fe1]